MSAKKYRYGHQPAKHRSRKVFLTIAVAVSIFAAISSVIYFDLKNNQAPIAEGEARTVNQVSNSTVQHLSVDEPLFSFELPGDWVETGRINSAHEQSITWQASIEGEDNRWLTVYVDKIPFDREVDRMLPVIARGNSVTYGDLSDDCASFTANKQAKWQDVEFLCNLSRPTNEIGTSSKEGINAVRVTGQTQGTHNYFFLYTDHNIQPNYMILYDVLKSFRAK